MNMDIYIEISELPTSLMIYSYENFTLTNTNIVHRQARVKALFRHPTSSHRRQMHNWTRPSNEPPTSSHRLTAQLTNRSTCFVDRWCHRTRLQSAVLLLYGGAWNDPTGCVWAGSDAPKSWLQHNTVFWT